MLSGHCSLAHEAEAGVVSLGEDPADSHARCNYTSLGLHGASIIACSCECHAGVPYCDRCGEVGTERCTDDTACAGRLIDRVTANNNHLVRKDPAKALAGHTWADGTEVGGQAPPPPRTSPKATKGRNECACGCGGRTNGTFCMGHDAKLKSRLRQQWNDGAHVEAYVELAERGWLKSAGHLDEPSPEAAREIKEQLDG